MDKLRRDGLSLLVLGMTLPVLLLAYLLARPSNMAMQDFRTIYNPTRCLFRHCDPYQKSEVLHIYQAEGSVRTVESESDQKIVTSSIYPPSAFAIAIPFAMLPWDIARRAWALVDVGALLCASFLTWELAAEFAPTMAGAFIAFLLFNSEVLIVMANPSGVSISLIVISVWCLLRGRFIPLGIVCMALALALKPQLPGFIFLYFLLARGNGYRRQALYSLIVTAAICLPAILWVWHLSPNWVGELHSNLQSFVVRGAEADPGPATSGSHGAGAMICLQAVYSLISDTSLFYNTASWATVSLPLLVWIGTTLRVEATPKLTLLALAAITPLSMLPVYHHMYDAKLLLLTIPGCAVLWKERGAIGRSALLLTLSALFLTGDFPSSFISHLISSWHAPVGSGWSIFKLALERVPVPLVLLTIGIFYLCAYVQQSRLSRPDVKAIPAPSF
jgi:hypothetical protein